MQALVVTPGAPSSTRVAEVDVPVPAAGQVPVRVLDVGLCGTDREIIDGDYGWAPPGEERLVLGHESLGRVLSVPSGTSGFAVGDLVVGVVRRPDPVPCAACGVGQFDMCRNGRYTEHGIKEIHGFGATLWTVEADYALKLDESLRSVGVLMEPTTILAKAWDHIERIAARADRRCEHATRRARSRSEQSRAERSSARAEKNFLTKDRALCLTLEISHP